jgi:hypothetical protein
VNETVQRVRDYIDGFNFWYAAFVDGTFGRWRWLDHVRCSTAQLKPTPCSPRAHIRQGIYLNALRAQIRQHRGSVFDGKVKFVREVRRAYLMDGQLPLTKHGRVIQRPPKWGPVGVERP